MSNQTVIRFNNSNRQFYTELKKRVDNYFKDNKISKNGEHQSLLKKCFYVCRLFYSIRFNCGKRF